MYILINYPELCPRLVVVKNILVDFQSSKVFINRGPHNLPEGRSYRFMICASAFNIVCTANSTLHAFQYNAH